MGTMILLVGATYTICVLAVCLIFGRTLLRERNRPIPVRTVLSGGAVTTRPKTPTDRQSADWERASESA